MKTDIKNTRTYKLDNLYRLDPITVYVENIEPGKGSITIKCYGEAWTAYWGAMSGGSIEEFICRASNECLAFYLSDIKSTITDFEKISEDINYKVESDFELGLNTHLLIDAYGDEFFNCLPEVQNPEYVYLCRIIDAVREAFKSQLNKQKEKNSNDN